MRNVDLSKFESNKSFYGPIELLISVKSFDLQAIRKRYLKSAKRDSGKKGSVERRLPSLGGVIYIKVDKGQIIDQRVLVKLPEVRGIDSKEKTFAFSSENKVFIVTSDNIHKIENDWFSYIHTVNFSPFHEDEILVSSSGYDCFFIYNYLKNHKKSEWFAWDHGINDGYDKETDSVIKLTRSKSQSLSYKKNGIAHKLIDSPLTQQLPTAQRAAFINSVYFHPEWPDTYVATMFHKGEVVLIQKENMSTLFKDLKAPHGGKILRDGVEMVTNTGGGQVQLRKNDSLDVYDFSNLPDNQMHNVEWLQNSIDIEDIIITIDSNRNSLVIYDPHKELIDTVHFDSNWAIQDMVKLPENLALSQIDSSIKEYL